MKKILVLSLTFALASAFVGISDGLKTNSQNALRQQIDNLHILANTMETNDKEMAINDEYTINKSNNYRILPRNIDTYREDTNQNKVRQNINNTATNNRTNTKVDNNENLINNTNTNNAQNPNNINGTTNQPVLSNNRINNGITSGLNNANNTNGTNNLSYNNQGTSPYGINNANSGVLPNQNNGNKTIDGAVNNANNLDSMVRTNNIDTYKNNENTNINGNIYNNNGGLINNGVNNTANNGIATNMPNATNDISPNTVDANRGNMIDNTVKNNSSVTTETTKRNSTTTNNTTSNSNNLPKTTTTANDTTNEILNDNTTKNTTTTTQNFVLDMATIQQEITDLNDRISTQNEEMNTNMELARSNMSKLLDNSITLEQTKIKLINGYSHTLQCMTQKLAQNHFDLMHSAGMLALAQTKEGNSADLSPIYLEIKGTLLSREIYFDCANDALKAINSQFADISENSISNLNNDSEKTTDTTNSQNDNTTSTTTKATTQNGISKSATNLAQKPVANSEKTTGNRTTNGTEINSAGIQARPLENKNANKSIVNVREPAKNQAKLSTPNPNHSEKQSINSPKAKLDNSKQSNQDVDFGKTKTNSIIASEQF